MKQSKKAQFHERKNKTDSKRVFVGCARIGKGEELTKDRIIRLSELEAENKELKNKNRSWKIYGANSLRDMLNLRSNYSNSKLEQIKLLAKLKKMRCCAMLLSAYAVVLSLLTIFS